MRLSAQAKGRDVLARRGLAIIAALLVLSVPAAIFGYIVLLTGSVSVNGGKLDALGVMTVLDSGRYAL